MRRRRRGRRNRDGYSRAPIKASVGLFILALLALFLTRVPTRTIPVPQELPDWIREAPLSVNPWSRPGTAMEAVSDIVVHYVGNPGTTAAQNRSYFEGLSRSHETYASSNFLIGLEGEILLCVPIGEVAYCSGERNRDTLSIEVCHPDETGEFTAQSYASLIRLVNWLREFYGLSPENVIRHYDVTGKLCPKYYVEQPGAWEQFQRDLTAEAGTE